MTSTSFCCSRTSSGHCKPSVDSRQWRIASHSAASYPQEKSWLLRRFAHGKPAVLLVAERLALGAQLTRFAEQLAPLLDGVTPDIPDTAGLFRLLFRLARDRTVLAVIDEFPLLLGTTSTEVDRTLSAIQAVVEEEEERDTSQLKLIVCGSSVVQMEALQTERNPLHGRLVPLELRALPWRHAAAFLEGHEVQDRFVRFAVAGGMPRYLSALAGGNLEAGLAPGDLFDTEVAPELAAHVAPVFEELCREFVRTSMGATATRVGRWWGNALNPLRRSGERSTEEIDIVGTARKRVTLVGEVKWTSRPLVRRHFL